MPKPGRAVPLNKRGSIFGMPPLISNKNPVTGASSAQFAGDKRHAAQTHSQQQDG